MIIMNSQTRITELMMLSGIFRLALRGWRMKCSAVITFGASLISRVRTQVAQVDDSHSAVPRGWNHCRYLETKIVRETRIAVFDGATDIDGNHVFPPATEVSNVSTNPVDHVSQQDVFVVYNTVLDDCVHLGFELLRRIQPLGGAF